jgi:hypothetical protein
MNRCCDCKYYYRGWKWLWTPMCLQKLSTNKITGNQPKSCEMMRSYWGSCESDGKLYEEREIEKQ